MLTLKLTRISPTSHTLEYRRDDGTGESIELETKSFLVHDFIHYVIESEANLSEGFFGLLLRNNNYADLSMREGVGVGTKESLDIERVTGPFTSLVKGEGDSKDVMEGLKKLYDALGERLPSWLTEEMLMAAQARYRKVIGEWNALPFGETMTLSF